MGVDQYLEAKKTLAREEGFRPQREANDFSMVLCYPNSYRLGMSNLGFQTMYYLFNLAAGAYCERAFLPDEEILPAMELNGDSLLSLESSLPLGQFDVIAFSVSFELDYINLLRMLRLGKVPLCSKERGDDDPLVMVGGPCATFNPEPLADFADIFFIGEGESLVEPFAQAYSEWKKTGRGKGELLKELAKIPGVYVPSLYEVSYDESGLVSSIKPLPGVPAKVERQWVRNLDSLPVYSHVLTPEAEFGEMFLVEVSRGCGRHCRFCMAGYCFRMPRHRSLERLWETIQEGFKYRRKIGLVGAAVSDYPDIDILCQRIMDAGGEISVASLRADSLRAKLAEALAKSGQKTITLAPEAGSERLRRVINKTISNEDLFRAVDLANSYQIFNVRYYLMVGLPTEARADLDAAVELAQSTVKHMQEKHGNRTGQVTLSIAPFVPKPFTPFQWVAMEELDSLEKKLSYIKRAVQGKGKIRVSTESSKWSVVQGVLARGDRRLGKILQRVLEDGGNFSAWKRALGPKGFSFYAYRARQQGEVLPWSHLEIGVAEEYFKIEQKKGMEGKVTGSCRVGSCKACRVCGNERG